MHERVYDVYKVVVSIWSDRSFCSKWAGGWMVRNWHRIDYTMIEMIMNQRDFKELEVSTVSPSPQQYRIMGSVTM